MRHPTRTPTIAVVAALLLASVAVAPLGGASPPPGDDNPWLQRRIAAVAHAGGEDENPQETLYAYTRNTEAGVPILDGDLQITSDGIPVLIHDNTLDRTTNGSGPVNAMTFAQIQALDAAYWFSEDCAACHDRPADDYIFRGVRTGDVAPPEGFTADDFAVPSLEQLFERFPDAYFNMEIKDDAADVTALAEAVADLIHDHGLTDRVVIASFGGPGMDAFRAAAPDVATSATLDEVTAFFVSNEVPRDAQILDVPPVYRLSGVDIDVVTPDFVRRAHEAGLAVWVWMNSGSQQNRDFYTQLLDMGVDGLNVSRPALLMDLLNERGDAWDPNAPGPDTSTTVPDTGSPTTLPGGPPGPTPGGPVAGPATAGTTPAATPADPVGARPTYTG